MSMIAVQEWLDAHPTLIQRVGMGDLHRVQALVGDAPVRGCTDRYGASVTINVISQKRGVILIDGFLGFATDKANVLLCQIVLDRDEDHNCAADITRYNDNVASYMVGLLVSNLVGRRVRHLVTRME